MTTTVKIAVNGDYTTKVRQVVEGVETNHEVKGGEPSLVINVEHGKEMLLVINEEATPAAEPAADSGDASNGGGPAPEAA